MRISTIRNRLELGAVVLALCAFPLPASHFPPFASVLPAQTIPLPEHPRPDFYRSDWINLNGEWRFRTDAADAGARANWQNAPLSTSTRIVVPFSWAAPLSRVADTVSQVAWYERTIDIPRSWRGKRIFLVVGASDWRTEAWLDGVKIGEHQGGYTPFSFELTPRITFAGQRLTIRVDDTPHPFKLYGKQGYGDAKGIWQTVYLEARGTTPLSSVHFTPDIDRNVVGVDVRLLDPAPKTVTVQVDINNVAHKPSVAQMIQSGRDRLHFEIPLPNAHRWTLDDPFLHEATITVSGVGVADRVDSYFGMRKISVTNLPGTTIPYVSLNNSPVYLQLALDQAYHPTGFYTFPTDSILRMEILRAKQIGLNGLREHIKIESPRKLYWADKLGLLIMADVPNWWGPPDSLAFREHENATRAMIDRDYNHPAVFAWVMFNETWGLTTKVGDRDRYLPETQVRVASVARLAKSLDSTRLVEDNSICCGRGHTITDINSWHEYLPGWRWHDYMRVVSDSTYPGSTYHFEPGYRQDGQPMINSEFGNVWGYEGSTGDVDWSWDYHLAVNEFRRNPKLAGWLYTEHHDVINEWNGYWRFDRTNKETGLGEFIPGMSLRDLHAPMYIAVGEEMARASRPGENVSVPLWASFLTGNRTYGDSLIMRTQLYGWNALGERKTWSDAVRKVKYQPWMSAALPPLSVAMPSENAVAVLAVRLEDPKGAVVARNFMTFVVEADPPREVRTADGRRALLMRVDPAEHTGAMWSRKTWSVLNGLKVDGAGSGYFEYQIPWPAGVSASAIDKAAFLVEASAKQLFGKDREAGDTVGGDFMRGGGSHDPSRNPNAYPMTDERKFPSRVTVRVNGAIVGTYDLADDPADHRGILSWFSQLRDGKLREAGSYGQLLRVPIPRAALTTSERTGSLLIRLEVADALPGGLAIYGRRFGRYPIDPSVLFVLR